MLTRTATILACAAVVQSGCRADPWAGAIFIADGTADLTVVAKVTDSRTRTPITGATVTAVRAGSGTILLATDSTAMPPPKQSDRGGRAVLHANFRLAADSSGPSIFVAQSFLRVQAPGFHPRDARISGRGRLDFPPKTKHPEVTVPVSLVHE